MKKTKICSKCKKRKPVKSFSKYRHASDGLQCYCKDCCKKHRNKNREKDHERNRKLRLEVLKAYGSKCTFCGEATVEYLQIDHINGNVERCPGGRRVTGVSLYTRLRKLGYPKENHRLLCSNCNFAREKYGDARAIELGKRRRDAQ